MISNGQPKAYSGQGRFVGNFIAFSFAFLLMLGSIAAVAFWSLDNVWIPGLAFLLLYTGAFYGAKEIIGRSDSLDSQDLHGERGEPLDAMASRVAESHAPAQEPRVPNERR